MFSDDYFSYDTIVSVATSAVSDAGVGVIRLSGADAKAAVDRVLSKTIHFQARYLHRARICIPGTEVELDDGLCVWFPEGESFTGEEVVELQLHGGVFVLKEIVCLLCETGLCRQALPGEFLFRAARNKKISITQAELLNQLIKSKSLYEVTEIRKELGGQRQVLAGESLEEIKNIRALLEVDIDFSDQNLGLNSFSRIQAGLKKVEADLVDTIERARSAKRVAEGLRVTIVGSPNVGKSTLFNMMVGEGRSIVSSEAGTTRDIVSEQINLGNYLVRLSDTAGLRESDNLIEAEGVERAETLAHSSDVIIGVLDASKICQEDIELVSKRLEGKAIDLLCLNKSDLIHIDSRREIELALEKSVNGKIFWTSFKDQRAVNSVLQGIAQLIQRKFISVQRPMFVTESELSILSRALLEIQTALELFEKSDNCEPEVLSVFVATADQLISGLSQANLSEDILSRVFSRFCIGK